MMNMLFNAEDIDGHWAEEINILFRESLFISFERIILTEKYV